MSNDVGRLLALAEVQWGLLTAAQAARLGVGRVTLSRLAAGGVLERLAHGLYRARGGGAVPFTDLRGTWLRLDPAAFADERWDEPGAVVSHRSAARVLDLGDLPEEPFEFTAAGRRQTRDRRVRFHRASLDRRDWEVVDGLPVTVARRVVADLLAERTDGAHVAAVVADAFRRRLVDPDELAAAIAPYAAAYGLRRGDGAALLDYLLGLVGESPAQLAERAEEALRDAPSSVAARLRAASAVAAAAALPAVPPEVLAAVRAATAAAATSEALLAAIDRPDQRAAFLRQTQALRAAMADPVVRALQRDAGLRERLAAQAAEARRLATHAGYGP